MNTLNLKRNKKKTNWAYLKYKYTNLKAAEKILCRSKLIFLVGNLNVQAVCHEKKGLYSLNDNRVLILRDSFQSHHKQSFSTALYGNAAPCTCQIQCNIQSIDRSSAVRLELYREEECVRGVF